MLQSGTTQIFAPSTTNIGLAHELALHRVVHRTDAAVYSAPRPEPGSSWRLMTSVYRSLSFAFLERGVLLVVGLASYVLIARWLTPEEIGIYSVAAALVAIGQVIREFGIGNYLIQAKDPGQREISATFGISLALGFLMFALFMAIAPFAGVFYRDARVADVVQLVAFGFLTTPFAVIPLALLRRAMQFDRVAAINVAANSVGTAVTLGLAYLGFGPQSLGYGAIALGITTAVGAWVVSPVRGLWRPTLRGSRPVLSFGGRSVGAAVVTTAAMDISDLAVGRAISLVAAAVCSRANGLVNIFNQQIMGAVRSVALPAFAQAHRRGDDLEPLYTSSTAAVTSIAWPFLGFLALFAKDTLHLMFGDQWDAAAPLVPVFAACGALGASYSLALTLAIAIGRIDVATRTDLIVQPIRALCIVLAATVFQTVESVAWAALAVNVIGLPYFLLVKNRLLATDWGAYRRAILASAALAAVSLAIPAASKILCAVDGMVGTPMLLAQAAICVVIWLPGVFYLKHPLSMNQFVRTRRDRAVERFPALCWLFPVPPKPLIKEPNA